MRLGMSGAFLPNNMDDFTPEMAKKLEALASLVFLLGLEKTIRLKPLQLSVIEYGTCWLTTD